jgi:hypothetical protein
VEMMQQAAASVFKDIVLNETKTELKKAQMQIAQTENELNKAMKELISVRTELIKQDDKIELIKESLFYLLFYITRNSVNNKDKEIMKRENEHLMQVGEMHIQMETELRKNVSLMERLMQSKSIRAKLKRQIEILTEGRDSTVGQAKRGRDDDNDDENGDDENDENYESDKKQKKENDD